MDGPNFRHPLQFATFRQPQKAFNQHAARAEIDRISQKKVPTLSGQFVGTERRSSDRTCIIIIHIMRCTVEYTARTRNYHRPASAFLEHRTASGEKKRGEDFVVSESAAAGRPTLNILNNSGVVPSDESVAGCKGHCAHQGNSYIMRGAHPTPEQLFCRAASETRITMRGYIICECGWGNWLGKVGLTAQKSTSSRFPRRLPPTEKNQLREYCEHRKP